MKLLIVLAFVALASAGNPAFRWEHYKTQHGKSYSAEEDVERRAIFEENAQNIHLHNQRFAAGEETYDQEVNMFTDMTVEEFRAWGHGLKYNAIGDEARRELNQKFLIPENLHVPKAVDWRKKGYVTPVKNQGQCGSCWAFSTVGSLEGQHFRKSKKLVSLSEQNLVDCDKMASGCEGASSLDQAYTYIKQNKGIDTEKSYPYTGTDGNCKFSKNSVGATDTGFMDITKMNETALIAATATVGPISVAIDASGAGFMSYKSGVYKAKDCSSTRLDHGVLVVGYGTLKGDQYYIVKNSWGTTWGMKGYIFMARNANNHCGIATLASYPTV